MKINNHNIILEPHLIQKDKNGNKFRVIQVQKDLTKPSKSINKVEHWYWIITLRYTQTDKKIKLTFDYNNRYAPQEN